MAFPAQCQTIEARDTWRIGSRDFRDCLRRWKAQRRALVPGALEAQGTVPYFRSIFAGGGVYPLFVV